MTLVTVCSLFTNYWHSMKLAYLIFTTRQTDVWCYGSNACNGIMMNTGESGKQSVTLEIKHSQNSKIKRFQSKTYLISTHT